MNIHYAGANVSRNATETTFGQSVHAQMIPVKPRGSVARKGEAVLECAAGIDERVYIPTLRWLRALQGPNKLCSISGGVGEQLKPAVLKTFALLPNCLFSIGSPQR